MRVHLKQKQYKGVHLNFNIVICRPVQLGRRLSDRASAGRAAGDDGVRKDGGRAERDMRRAAGDQVF